MRLSECWIKYFLVFISIRPWVSLYISVNLDCLLLVSSVAHPVFYHVRNTGEDRAVLHWTLSRALISFFNNGSQAALAYSSFGRTRNVYAISFTFFGQFQRLRCIVPSDLFGLAAVMETWADHLSKVREAINLFQLYTTEDIIIFSGVDCSYVRW